MHLPLLARASVLLLFAGHPVLAQDSAAEDDGARMERVADGVYAIIHEHATDQWPHGNTGVVVGEDGILVFDAAYLPSRAEADIALIRSISDKPIRYLVISHWHFDHNNGISAYRDAVPGITIISERNTADYIELNNTWWPRSSLAPESARRRSLAQLEERLVNRRDTAGTPLNEDGLRALERSVTQRRAEMEELESLEAVRPNLVFDGVITLTLGSRRIEVRDRGAANSPHDVTVYLPQERVLFAGDIIVQAPWPYLGESWPVSWIRVLSELERLPVVAIVPGHGPVLRDHDYTRQVRGLLESAVQQVDSLVRQGRTLVEVQDAVTLDAERAAVPVWNTPRVGGLWPLVVRPLIERVWRDIRGAGV